MIQLSEALDRIRKNRFLYKQLLTDCCSYDPASWSENSKSVSTKDSTLCYESIKIHSDGNDTTVLLWCQE